MNKAAFLDALRERLSGLPESEITRQIQHFAELIDDRLDMGMPEADAVSALGDPERLIADASLPVAAAAEASDWSAPIREIHLHMKNADAYLHAGALPEGVTARIEASERNAFTWSLDNGILTLAEAGEVRRGLFQRSRSLTLTLCGCEPGKLIADTHGGDLTVEGIRVHELAVVSASTGDISLRRFECGGRTEATCRSGDIEVSDARVGGDLKLENLSGDIELRRVGAASLRGRTASGDIEGEVLHTGSATLGAASGDIEVSELHATDSILCQTDSGDIELSEAHAPDLRLCAVSGDVTLHLPCGVYDISADTLSGDVALPPDRLTGGDPARVQIQTRSGDIKIAIAP